MIKAVFLDYTGTVLQQRGADMDAIVDCVVNASTIHTREELIEWWHQASRHLKAQCYKETYVSYDDLLVQLADMARMDIRFKKDGEKLQELIRNYWMYAPIYDDAQEFFDLCPLPVYILTEIGRDYVSICLRRNRIHINDIISSDEIKAFAPHEEFYKNALKKAECLPEEAVYISEDYDVCVLGAREAGMQGVLLDRKSVRRDAEGKRIRSLIELLPLIQIQNEKTK